MSELSKWWMVLYFFSTLLFGMKYLCLLVPQIGMACRRFDFFQWTKARGTPAGTRRPEDVPWRSPKGRNLRDFQGTFRGLLEDRHKKMIISWKKCFLDAIVLVLRICYCFLLEKQICKSSKWGRPRDAYGTQLRDVPGTRWWDVLGTSPGRRSYMFFQFNSETHLTCFDRLLEIL